ncbi:MAG: hypothetical protein KDK56_06270 [Simkania sp.]|nr:hypothetical protein [Simkania sp.]
MNYSKKNIVIIIAFLISTNLFSETLHIKEEVFEEKIKTKGSNGNFLGPSAQIKGSYDFDLGTITALFEGGPRQLRNNFTLGFCLSNTGRTGVKITTEHLMQDLKFNFFTGSEKKWVHQVAGGVGFKHVFEQEDSMLFLKSCQLDGYYAHSWGRNLGEKHIPPNKICINKRKIAGSDSWGGSGGVDLQFRKIRSILGLEANYDYLKYNTKNSHHFSKSGIGGGISLLHPFSDTLDLKAKASFRKPFNNYSGEFNWKPKSVPGLTVGLFGGYTAGKHRLASSYDIGIKLSYLFGLSRISSQNNKNSMLDCSASKNYLKRWLQEPTIKMPQVLAISDEKISCKIISEEEEESCNGVISGSLILEEGVNNVKFLISNLDSFTSTGDIVLHVTSQEANIDELIDINSIAPNQSTEVTENYFFDAYGSPVAVLNWELETVHDVCIDIIASLQE